MTGHTKEPWVAKQTQGWGQDWCIHNDEYLRRPLAKTISHSDVYYRHVRRTIRGEEVVTFSDPTPEGEDRKVRLIAQAEANAHRIVDCVNACATIPDPQAFMEAAQGMREALEACLEYLDHLDPACPEHDLAQNAILAFDATLGEQ